MKMKAITMTLYIASAEIVVVVFDPAFFLLIFLLTIYFLLCEKVVIFVGNGWVFKYCIVEKVLVPCTVFISNKNRMENVFQIFKFTSTLLVLVQVLVQVADPSQAFLQLYKYLDRSMYLHQYEYLHLEFGTRFSPST